MKSLDYKTRCEKKLGKEEIYRGTGKEYFAFKNAEIGKSRNVSCFAHLI